MAGFKESIKVASTEYYFKDKNGFMQIKSSFTFTEINKYDAQKIIDHLKEQFGL